MTDYVNIGELSPLNDFDRTIQLEQIDSVTGTRTPLTTGDVTAFLATSPAPDAAAADGTLSVAAVHVGGNPKVAAGGETYKPGTWLVHIDASALTVLLCTAQFANATPYLIVSVAGGVRKVGQLTYAAGSSGGEEE